MDRINGADTANIGQGRRGFKDENVVAGTAGTEVTAAFLNSLQEELVKVITEAGLELDKNDWTQLWQAIQIMIDSAFSNIQDNDTFLSVENVQDIVADFLSGQGATILYDDEGNALSIKVNPATTNTLGLVKFLTNDNAKNGVGNEVPTGAHLGKYYQKNRIDFLGSVFEERLDLIPYIQKAAYYGQGTRTGAIEIAFSADVSVLNTMMNFEFILVDYINNKNSPVKYKIGGYIYATASNWSNTSAKSDDPEKQLDVSFRFDKDNNIAYIYIGDISSEHNYLGCFLHNLLVRFAGAENEAWMQGIEVDLVSEFKGDLQFSIPSPAVSGNKLLDEIRYQNIVSSIPRNFGDMVPLPDSQVLSLTDPSVVEDNVFLEENWFYLAFKQANTRTLQSLTLEPYVRFIQAPDTDNTITANGYTSTYVRLYSSPDGVVWTNTNCTINGNKNGGPVVLIPTVAASAKYFQVGINFEDNNGRVHMSGFTPIFSN